MATLVATVRRLTGAVVCDVSDADITATLDAHRYREQAAPIDWERVVVSGDVVYKRGRFVGWGVFEPTTNLTATANVVSITQRDGTAATGSWTLAQDGTVVFASDQTTAPSLLLAAYSYDLNAACADVIDQLVGLCAGDYDVKLGDQTFSRSQGREGLQSIAAGFRRKCLPARATMMLHRMDEVASPVRQRRQAGWR